MERLTLGAFEDASDDFDALTLRTAQIDTFCSSAAWAVPALKAFHPEREPYIFRGAGGYTALARGVTPTLGRFLAPLEAMWGLASPLIGPDPNRLVAEAWVTMCGHQASWDSLWLSGLDPHGPIFKGLAELAGRQHQLFVGPPTLRRVASLADGLDGYLSRRSSAFRKSLKKTIRRAEEAGVVFQWFPHSPDDASRRSYYSRALAIDDKSWKGLQRAGLREGGMELFYDAMTRYLGAKDQLRVVIAQHDGVDIAMGFGGLLGGTFRGLQMSYDENFRHLGLGNLIQWQFITHLINEGVSQYDLGTEMEYKSRWAEEGLETIPLVIRKMGL